MGWKQRLIRFMQGRYGAYGNDALSRFLTILIFLLLLASLSRIWAFQIIALVLIIYMYFRLMSRNIYKRQQENNFYLRYEYKVKNFFAGIKRDFQQRKTHHIYRCPSCRQKIRVPRGKGRIEIRCPKCKTTFIKKS